MARNRFNTRKDQTFPIQYLIIAFIMSIIAVLLFSDILAPELSNKTQDSVDTVWDFLNKDGGYGTKQWFNSLKIYEEKDFGEIQNGAYFKKDGDNEKWYLKKGYGNFAVYEIDGYAKDIH